VATITVNVLAVVGLSVTVAGTEQFAPVGAPLQLNVAVPLIPAPPIAKVYLAVCPAVTVADEEPPAGRPKPIVAAVPVPVSATA
jgi:hypothetical protein